ncbi:SCO-spondin-like [Pomacea canaliculata]|uniref:SCO-spondin-like n=1 Tax=Pomacea canaliculata TaxID=400727 RepID=UPI000D72685F|nr:SCO-spondin-like [Pomacea canaliculata]
MRQQILQQQVRAYAGNSRPRLNDDADNTDNHIDKDRGEEKTTTEEPDDQDDDAVDNRGSDADTAPADTTTDDVSDEDTDDVATEIDRLKDDAELDEFLDEGDQDEDIQPKKSRHQESSANKDLAGFEPTAISSAHNTSLALRDYAVCQQSPNIDDLSQYLRTCPNCLVRWDRYQCPLHDQVLELKKWMTELQDLLSYGCRMDENCVNTDKCCHSRDPALGRAVEEMTELAKEMYDIFLESCSSCPRDGGWSEWCEWGSCSVSCGEGTRTRRRQCDSPTPKANGRPCQGLAMDSIPCSGPACCTDGNWSPWSPFGSCQGTCGQGLQERARTCSNPSPNHCGRTCPGPSADVRPCETGRDCCVDGNWAAWSSWSSCPVTCGRGSVDRYRTCSNPAPNYCGQTCPGLAREARSCEVGDCCVDGNWADWSSWSSCPVTCGRGTVDRYRTCNNPSPNYCGQTCPGPSRDMRACEVGDCCVDGEWGSWLSWSACSATCGSGSQSRMRRCDSPSPNFCGRRCPGPASEMKTCVSERDCCVDGNWGQWDPWSPCSASCGLAVRERERRCNNPAPNYCGQSCPGFDVQEETLDGNWADWSSWSSCPVTCGRGTVDRYRTCSNPAPNYCGQTCPGPSRDMRACELERVVDGQWGEWWRWSSCSATCERGTRERTRSCDSPSPNVCGRTCPGPKVERDTCDTGIPCAPVCVDGNWGQWERWGGCSVTCGQGIRDRRRQCDSPAPNFCGQSCPGSGVDRGTCDTRVPCPPDCVNGNWGLWGTWSACPVTCGQAQRERRRQCDSPSPNFCGETCPGLPVERIQFRCGPDEVAGNWESWQAWGACSVTCGRGQQLRRRVCDVAELNECMRPCPGSEMERRECGRDCCVDGNWGQWERWGGCSATCGQGSRDRRRQCDSPAPNFCGQSCPGSGVDRDTCDTRVPCPPECVNGNWGLWGTWSACPVTCGQAQRERRRQCDSPSPNFCGETCPGLPVERIQFRCGPDEVAGNWESWQAWGACSVTCGRGQQLRRRVCDVAELNECVRPCPGSEMERRECGRDCCVDGNWGQWERWGGCSVTCGQGSRERRRQCDSPAPNFCGQSCPGSGVDRDTCDTRVPCQPYCVDGNWGLWESWGACPVTCGLSQRERRRVCDSPPPNVCGKTCPGPSFERASHSCGPMEVDGNWGSWSTWSPCPVTCGQGQRERRRLCDSPSPNVCGRTCPGPSLERTVQLCGPEQVDGQWGMWGSWSACPVTCGMGQVERRRFCDAPAPNACGRSCPGPAIEQNRKQCGPEAIDGNWGSWEQWGACSATCGFGRQNRRRRCDSPSASECGRPCRGSDVDIQECNLRPCCAERQWSTWTQWSACSATCGPGTRTRQRTCQSVGFGEDCEPLARVRRSRQLGARVSGNANHPGDRGHLAQPRAKVKEFARGDVSTEGCRGFWRAAAWRQSLAESSHLPVPDILTGSRGAPVTAGRASAHADAPASIPVETKWISRTAAPPSHVRRGNVTCARCVQSVCLTAPTD